MSKTDEILMKILNCELEELKFLNRVVYDLDDIVIKLKNNGNLNSNSIIEYIFTRGIIDLRAAFKDNKDKIKSNMYEKMEALTEKYLNFLNCLKNKDFWQAERTIENEGFNDGRFNEDIDELISIIKDLNLINNKQLDLNSEEDYYLDLNNLRSHIYVRRLDFYKKWMPDDVERIEIKMSHTFESLEKISI